MFPIGKNKHTIKTFNGIWSRGSIDSCPEDHGISGNNMLSVNKNDLSTRPGTTSYVTNSFSSFRSFQSTINGITITLYLGFGNIYRGDTGVTIYSHSGLIDMTCINMFNKTFILPAWSGATNVGLLLWDGINTVRQAAGLAPIGATMSAVTAMTAGNIPPGVHLFAVSYITNTGFTTQPGPKPTTIFVPVSWTSPGAAQVTLTNIPIGPTGTVARQIFVTQAGLDVFYYAPEGLINDNTTTTVTLNFFDTDLAVSADNLFDLLEIISPNPSGKSSLTKHHGCLCITGVTENYVNGSYSNPLNPDIVLVSNSGDAESFSIVTGFIQIPSNNDNNIVSNGFQINDILYFCKCYQGIFSVIDNLSGNPSSWQIVPIDYGAGCGSFGVSIIASNDNSESTSNLVLIAAQDGLFLFNGYLQRPPLSYKIDNIWKSNFSASTQTRNVKVILDYVNEQIYVMFSTTTFLVADFADGLDPTNIRWFSWNFNYGLGVVYPTDMIMIEGNLVLLFAGSMIIYVMNFGPAPYLDDNGTPIPWDYQLYLMPDGIGELNSFTNVRARLRSLTGGNVTVNLGLYDQTNTLVSSPAALTASNPAPADLMRLINFLGEKMSVKLSGTAYGVNMQRVDVFSNILFSGRPG